MSEIKLMHYQQDVVNDKRNQIVLKPVGSGATTTAIDECHVNSRSCYITRLDEFNAMFGSLNNRNINFMAYENIWKHDLPLRYDNYYIEHSQISFRMIDQITSKTNRVVYFVENLNYWELEQIYKLVHERNFAFKCWSAFNNEYLDDGYKLHLMKNSLEVKFV